MNVLALADDATGALEVGARFAEVGLETSVRFVADVGGYDTLVVDIETRHVPPPQAYTTVREIAAEAKRGGVRQLFKKTDSTLRGPLAAEFQALLAVFPERSIVFAPAYPSLGRTVRNGVLYVDGMPLSRTAFASDPLNPSRESSIPALLDGCGVPVVLVRNAAELRGKLCSGGGIFVCDSSTDADLADVAATIEGVSAIAAGPAALASVWAASLVGRARNTKAKAVRLHRGQRCLVINGSLHRASQQQVGASGIPALRHDAAARAQDLVEQLASVMRQSGWAILSANGQPMREPLAVARHAAQVTEQAIRLAEPDCLVVFGGDTVFAILRELGVSEAEPVAEILPGTASSTISLDGRRMLLVTKAGGFGGPDTLTRIREILEKR